jgi:predicted phosphoribosyltransferase
MFKDRVDAAHQLAKLLAGYKNALDTLIVAIPRGGVVIGAELAKELHLPLDILLVKKIGAPGQEELAIGATDMQEYVLDPFYQNLPAYQEYIKKRVSELRDLLQKRTEAYRAVCPTKSWKQKTIILVDDGVATGQTMQLALHHARKEDARKVIIALPVCALEAYNELKNESNNIYCLSVPDYFVGVSRWYQRFDQVDDAQAIALLAKVGK